MTEKGLYEAVKSLKYFLGTTTICFRGNCDVDLFDACKYFSKTSFLLVL